MGIAIKRLKAFFRTANKRTQGDDQLYSLVLITLHKDDMERMNFSESIDLMLELVAAFCLGEVELQRQCQEGKIK